MDRCWRCCTSTAVAMAADRRCRVAHRSELGHEDLAVELVPQLACESHGDPRLADPSGPGQRDQSIASQPVREQLELLVPTDQPGRLGRNPPHR